MPIFSEFYDQDSKSRELPRTYVIMHSFNNLRNGSFKKYEEHQMSKNYVKSKIELQKNNIL